MFLAGIDEMSLLARDFRIRFAPATKTFSTIFVLGSYSDGDSGGFVLSEMQRNMTICIEEKTRKVARVRSRYPEWWLALVDTIGYGDHDESERADLRRLIQMADQWDKILLVSPLDPTKGFEL